MTILHFVRPHSAVAFHRRHFDNRSQAARMFVFAVVRALDMADATALPGFREMADTLRWEDIR